MTIENEISAAVRRELGPLVDELRELRRRLDANAPDDRIGDEECRRICGDKSPGAWNMWLSRHPDFPVQRAGRKRFYSRVAVMEWLEKRKARRGAAQ